MALQKIPVTIVSGFLGAGKTTLVNHLLAQCADQRIGIIVNEFGEVGIDGELILADETVLIEITNGCICCTVRKDLSAAVTAMLEQSRPPPSRLIIETSGLADPAPVLQTFLADPAVLQRVSLESVVTVVDAAHVERHLGDDIVREQIAFADLVVLNKVELIAPPQLERVQRELRRLNPTAQVLPTSGARVDAATLLGPQRLSVPQLLALEPGLLDDGEHDHEHDDTIRSCSVEADGALDADRFNRWINRLVMRDGARLLRSKGVLHLAGEGRQFTVHSVHMLVDARPGRRWRDGEPRRSRMVFIGRDLDAAALQDGFRGCVAIASASAREPQALLTATTDR